MVLVIRSTGDQPVASRINMLFFTNTTRGQSWIELTAWGDFQNHFHPLSFSFKHTTHKQIRMEKCFLWFVWCMYTRWTKNNYSISPFVIVFAQHFSFFLGWMFLDIHKLYNIKGVEAKLTDVYICYDTLTDLEAFTLSESFMFATFQMHISNANAYKSLWLWKFIIKLWIITCLNLWWSKQEVK